MADDDLMHDLIDDDGVLNVKGLQITDSEGRARIRMSTTPDDNPYFAMTNALGKGGVIITMNNDDVCITMNNAKDVKQVELILRNDAVGLGIRDNTGIQRISLSLDSNPALILLDCDGSTRLLISVNDLSAEILAREATGTVSVYPLTPKPPQE